MDLPHLVHEAVTRNPRLSVAVSGVLGPDPLLARGAAPAGSPVWTPVIRRSGSSWPRPVRHGAGPPTRCTRWRAVAAGVRGLRVVGGPTVASAVAALRAAGAERLAVASWFLAPGRLPDRIAEQVRALDPTP